MGGYGHVKDRVEVLETKLEVLSAQVEALKNQLRSPAPPKMMVNELVAAAARATGFSPRELSSPLRVRKLMLARIAACLAARRHHWTVSQIGMAFNRDHTSIQYYINHKMTKDPHVINTSRRIEAELIKKEIY
ncbi:MAG: hypothetical protein J4F41_00115 [Alphaproteobacteria bacterium]|nr:hypothetical protein [Alphaproteobacteria bacterium]